MRIHFVETASGKVHRRAVFGLERILVTGSMGARFAKSVFLVAVLCAAAASPSVGAQKAVGAQNDTFTLEEATIADIHAVVL